MALHTAHSSLRGTLIGLTSLGFALLGIWLTLPLLYPAASPTDAATQRFPGRAFTPIVALRSEVRGESLTLLEAQPSWRDGQWTGNVVMKLTPDLSADDYAQLRLSLEGLRTDQRLFLFWQTSATPGEQQHAELIHDASSTSWRDLTQLEGWAGRISELTFGVFGPANPPPLTLHRVDLYSLNRTVFIERALWDWRRFKPWLQSSANQYPGVRDGFLWHPGAAAGSWAGLALLGVLAAHLLWRPRPRVTVIAGLWCIALPWISLDSLWQHQLNLQLDATRADYAGLTQAEKHSREDDANLQAYAERLRTLLAPLRHKRLFLLTATKKRFQYPRLRLQFHLLPLNVYNYGEQLLPPGEMRAGDYLLLLEPITTITYDAAGGTLSDGHYRVRATRLDQDLFGTLFRLDAASEEAP